MVLNNSTTSEPVFYKATSSIKTITNRSLPYEPLAPAALAASFNDTTTEEEQSGSLKALNDRVDVLENKLRKFGIE